MDYFVLWFKLDYRHQYTIWCAGDGDSPDKLYSNHGLIPVFDSINSLKKYADINKIKLVEEPPILHNLDQVKVWLKLVRKKNFGHELLAAWNLFGDIAAIDMAVSLKFEALTQSHLSQYRKLFTAENIFRGVGNVRPKYHPKWTKYDAQSISKVLIHGFKLLRKSFRYQST